MMDKKVKFMLIVGPAVLAFVYAMTSPIIQIYFMRLVPTRILAVSEFLTLGLAAAVSSSIPSDRMKKFYRKHFFWIVVIDVTCFCVISFASLEYVTVRFIGFSVLSAVSTNIWSILMKDALNHVMDGDALTNWTSFAQSYELWCSFVGGMIAVIFTTIPVDICIGLQCAVNIFMGYTDIYAYKKLRHTIKNKEAQNGVQNSKIKCS